MAREIKFRAWDTDGRMSEPFTLATGYVPFISEPRNDAVPFAFLGVRPDRFTLMQCTGITDVRGKEIYESDIVYVEQNIYAQKRLTVEWEYDRWGFKEEFDNGDYYNGYAIRWERVQIIGNIYENPDLLDKQT